MQCMRMTAMRRRLMTTFHIRYKNVSLVSQQMRTYMLTPPVSVFDTKTNIS